MLNILIFTLIFLGLLICFGVKFEKVTIKKRTKIKTALDVVNEINGKQKIAYTKKTHDYAQKTLESIGQTDKIKNLKFYSIALSISGFIIGIMVQNIILAFILSVGLYFIPFWCVDFYFYSYEKSVNNQLEIALNIISNTYARDKEFISAINSNINDIGYPVKDAFIYIKNKIESGADVVDTLESSKSILKNRMFNEWIDNVKRCLNNQMLIGSLFPVIRKLSLQKKYQLENETLMYAPIKEALSMSVLSISILPLTFFVSKDWFYSLTQNFFGVVIIGITIITILFTINKAIKLSKPIDINDL